MYGKKNKSGLPILYNNIGAFKERIPKREHYFIVYDDENLMNDIEKLYLIFENMINYIINNTSSFNFKIPEINFDDEYKKDYLLLLG